VEIGDQCSGDRTWGQGFRVQVESLGVGFRAYG
jgi:hypothetical protein